MSNKRTFQNITSNGQDTNTLNIALLQNLYDSIQELKSENEDLKSKLAKFEKKFLESEFEKEFELERKKDLYGKLLTSEYGRFGDKYGFQLPSQILDELQFITSNYKKSDEFKNYALKILKLMTAVLNEKNLREKIDRIFTIVCVDARISTSEMFPIVESIYHLDCDNELESEKACIKAVVSNPYLKIGENFLDSKSTDSLKELLKESPIMNPNLVIRSLIKRDAMDFSKDTSSEIYHLVSDAIFRVTDHDQFYNLLSKISEYENIFCSNLRKKIYIDNDNIIERLQELAKHILKKDYNNSKNICEFISYLNNVYVDFEFDNLPIFKSQKLKEVVFNMLNRVSDQNRKDYSREIERICLPEVFDIKNWKDIKFCDYKIDKNGIRWYDKSDGLNFSSEGGKENLANMFLDRICKAMSSKVLTFTDKASGKSYKELAKVYTFNCDDSDMLNAVRLHINKLVDPSGNNHSLLKHYISFGDSKKIHFEMYEIYNDPEIKQAYIQACENSKK